MTVKVLYDYDEFWNKVGLLIDLKYSYGIDLDPCYGLLGLFKPHRLPELQKYVEEHPEYHIISEMNNDIFINHTVEHCFGFYLGEGDKDPEIMYVPKYDKVFAFDIETHWNDDSYWLDPFKLRKNKRPTQF